MAANSISSMSSLSFNLQFRLVLVNTNKYFKQVGVEYYRF